MDFQVVIDSLRQIVVDIINFIPNLINGLIILLVGYVISRIVRWLLESVLKRLRFDPLVERSGVTGSLRGLGVQTPLSRIIAQTVFALLLLSFLITATRLMELEAVAQLLERLLLFLPNAIAALIVFLLGGIVATFAGNLVTTIATAGGLAYARRLGRIVQYLISLIVVILALDVLGLDTSLLVTALTIMIGAFGLAIGLALGLGARGTVQHVLAGYYLRQRFPLGQPIIFDNIQGEISGIGSVNTIVVGADGTVVIPNSRLLSALVRVPPRSSAPETPPQP
jgi:small-conductance mechanosensitive channel